MTEALSDTGKESAKQDVAPHLLLNPELSRMAFDERILAFAQAASIPSGPHA